MALLTWLYAVSSVTWSAVLMAWSVMPSGAPSRAPLQYHRSSTACTLWKGLERVWGGRGQRLGHVGLWESLWCCLVSRGSSVASHTGTSFSVSSHSGGSNTFFFLFACEGVLSRGPASRSRKQQGWDAPWDPWYSGPSQTSPVPRVLLRLCISFASEAPWLDFEALLARGFLSFASSRHGHLT